jgi:hypothetical protein
MKQAQRIKRAHEEIEWCNIEAHCLLTFIYDEDALFQKVLRTLDEPKMRGPIKEYITCRRQMNNYLLEKLHHIHSLDGFTRDSTIGNRVGHVREGPQLVIHEKDGFLQLPDENDDVDVDDDAHDDLQDEIGTLVEYIFELPL